METDGVNYDVSTDHIIEFLKKWEEKVPFLITECECDTLVIRLDGSSPYIPEMVGEAVPICPDLTAGDDSQEEMDKLIALVRKSNELYFWWD
jgi:hypothetical protein